MMTWADMLRSGSEKPSTWTGLAETWTNSDSDLDQSQRYPRSGRLKAGIVATAFWIENNSNLDQKQPKLLTVVMMTWTEEKTDLAEKNFKLNRWQYSQLQNVRHLGAALS